MNLVLGSGPSSVFCALALLKKGERVTMMDPGTTLETERAEAVSAASSQSKSEWSDSFLEMIRDKTDPNVKGLPKKLVYGSDYPFRSSDKDLKITFNRCESAMSHALGGLSNVWGANVLPLLRSETATWPVSVERLWPFYEEVCKHLPISSREDDLTELFGDCFSNVGKLPISQQASALLASLEAHRDSLKTSGIYFGTSRLAVKASECEVCGLCLYGCPRRLIYSSADSLNLLRSFPGFKYLPGVLAERVEEADSEVRVLVKDVHDGSRHWMSAGKAYVGCGPIGSTALMLASIGKPAEEVVLKDSQYFLAPFALFRGPSGVTSEPLHTLAQAIVEVISPSICERAVHLLFYSYNDLYLRAIRKLCGPLFNPMRPLIHKALNHMMVVQGYLHSDYSGSLGVSWKDSSELALVGYEHPDTKRYFRAVLRLLRANWRALGGIPISPMASLAPIGKSYHLGASFPMSAEPTGWQSDTLGRVRGLQRVHVVDASVLPAIPAQNTTLTAMANAYRIGAES